MYPLQTKGGIKVIFRVMAFVYLVMNTITDVRRKEIDIRVTVIVGIAFSFLRLSGVAPDWSYSLMNMVPCAVLLAANRLLAGTVGAGDVWVAGMLGLLLPGSELMGCMILGFWLAGGWGVIKKAGRYDRQRTEIPLLPFLLLAYVIGWCL